MCTDSSDISITSDAINIKDVLVYLGLVISYTKKDVDQHSFNADIL